MNCVIVAKKTSYDPEKDGITTFHAALFHGKFVNTKVDDHHLGDALTNPLRLEKNAYDCRHIIQPQRNLIVPQHIRERLAEVPNIDFFPVIFEKVFFTPAERGDFSVGPRNFSGFRKWWDSFRHEPRLKEEIEPFFELIIPELVRLQPTYADAARIQFNLQS